MYFKKKKMLIFLFFLPSFKTANGGCRRKRCRYATGGAPKMVGRQGWPAEGELGLRRTMTPLRCTVIAAAAAVVLVMVRAGAQSLCDAPQCECDDALLQVRCECRRAPQESQVYKRIDIIKLCWCNAQWRWNMYYVYANTPLKYTTFINRTSNTVTGTAGPRRENDIIWQKTWSGKLFRAIFPRPGNRCCFFNPPPLLI